MGASRASCVLAAWVVAAACSGEEDLPPDPAVQWSGGQATVFDTTRDAFSRLAPGVDRDLERDFFKGRALFRDPWVTAPSSTQTRDGLGPMFNARSCERCHVRDGRGRPPLPDEQMLSMLIRVSVPGPDGAPVPDPTYGGQLQPQSVAGVPFEARPSVTYAAVGGAFGDGTAYELRAPSYEMEGLGYGAFAPGVMFSPRVAPAMVGLGLLEAIAEADILALADPTDADGDGISGRPNHVLEVDTGATVLGRFGWKANQPSLRQQDAGAFLGDIGITSSLFPTEVCTPAQGACMDAISGGDPELLDVILDNVTAYTQLLAVPARRDYDAPEVVRGERLFGEAGCASCHVPSFETSSHPTLPYLEGQRIFPYTDMLLHDMGEELADGRPDFDATGREWRTPPLWGIGLIEEVNDHNFLLHDGRARSLEEAILWHGGEAEDSRERYRTMAAEERAAVLAFLRSL